MSIENLGKPDSVGLDEIAVAVASFSNTPFVTDIGLPLSGKVDCASCIQVELSLSVDGIAVAVKPGENNISDLGGSTFAVSSHFVSATNILLSIYEKIKSFVSTALIKCQNGIIITI